MFEFSEEQIRSLLLGIYTGSLTPYALPQSLYYAIADYLKKGLYKGYGGGLSDFAVGSKDFELLSELRENVYMFSGAKTYQQMRVMSGLLAEGEQVMPFPAFRTAAREVFDQFNKTWLRTEYDTAIGQAQCAVKWKNIEQNAKVLPLIEYYAVMDANTSDICRPLNGVRLPVNDPFWKRYAPLNHFNCRCVLRQLEEGEITSAGKIRGLEEEIGGKMQEIFKMNPGIEKVIYSDDHPYFDVPKKDKSYAQKNFNLPIPPADKAIKYTPVVEPKIQPKPEQKPEPSKRDVNKPTPEEAIRLYTNSWTYGRVNGYLRTGKLTPDLVGYIEDVIGGIDAYLDAAPKYQGTVYRGLRLGRKDAAYKEFIKAIKNKGEIVDKGFMSTSGNEGVTTYFRDTLTEDSFLFEIKGKSGVSIRHLSEAPTEEEVLFKRGTKFKVVSYEEGGNEVVKFWKVKLEEI